VRTGAQEQLRQFAGRRIVNSGGRPCPSHKRTAPVALAAGRGDHSTGGQSTTPPTNHGTAHKPSTPGPKREPACQGKAYGKDCHDQSDIAFAAPRAQRPRRPRSLWSRRRRRDRGVATGLRSPRPAPRRNKAQTAALTRGRRTDQRLCPETPTRPGGPRSRRHRSHREPLASTDATELIKPPAWRLVAHTNRIRCAAFVRRPCVTNVEGGLM
jgi:hypothetical protein